MRTGLFASAALVLAAASVVVISAQHHGDGQKAHAVTRHQMMSHCGSDEEATRAHHAHLAAALGLTTEQTATVERVATEACAAMARYHEQILAVLTPEQRAKLQELHGSRDHGGQPASAVKRHGGF